MTSYWRHVEAEREHEQRLAFIRYRASRYRDFDSEAAFEAEAARYRAALDAANAKLIRQLGKRK